MGEVPPLDRLRRAEEALARLRPGYRYVGLTSRGWVTWPGVGRFYHAVRLPGLGTAWTDPHARAWLWQPLEPV